MNDLNVARIKGDRLNLCLLMDDSNSISTYVKWANDEDLIWRLGFNQGSISRQEIEQWATKERDSNDIIFSLVTRADNTLIGLVRLKRTRFSSTGRLEIFIGEPDYLGRSYGTETLYSILKFAFEECCYHRIEALIVEDDVRAVKSFSKVGFRLSGIFNEDYWAQGKWHNVVNMEILYDDWIDLQERIRGFKYVA